jgi:HAD superfamily hydrolase (TIGR01509 family)
MNIFLTSTNKMTSKNPSNLDNQTKFGVDFESRIGLSKSEIITRFQQFYRTDFAKVCQIMKIHPIAIDLLKHASNHFDLVAATNPLFPFVANETRFSQTGLDIFPWVEITSAEDYHFAKPHIEYYEELLERINKKPSECMIIGDDPINDMVAGKLGIKTFLVKSNGRAFADIIETDPKYKNIDFPIDYTGTLEDLFESIKLMN